MLPIAVKAGIDPVYFGLMFVLNGAIGLITPPVGTVLNVVAGVGRMRMDDVTRGVMPFMLVQFLVMFLLVLFPDLVMVPAHGARLVRRTPSFLIRVLFAKETFMKRNTLKTLVAALALTAFGTTVQAQDKTIKFATQNPKGHPIMVGMEKF
eukprot:gene22502-42816_t